MSVAKQLYDLQELDSELEGKQQTLDQTERLLADDREVRQARERLELMRRELRQREMELRRQEGEMEETHHKLTAMEAKLYSGTVTSFKELQSLQQDVEIFKRKHREQEDGVLALMEGVEEGKRLSTELAQRLEETEQKRRAEVERLSQQRGELQAAIAAVEEKRSSLLGRIEQEEVKLYRELRRSRQPAVARVEQGRCQGCRVSLSQNEIQKARAAIIQCSNCRRILFSA